MARKPATLGEMQEPAPSPWVLEFLRELRGDIKSLTVEVQNWAFAQKEQNGTVKLLQRDFNEHVRIREKSCPLLDVHLLGHRDAENVKQGKVQLLRAQWQLAAGIFGAGASLATGVAIALRALGMI